MNKNFPLSSSASEIYVFRNYCRWIKTTGLVNLICMFALWINKLDVNPHYKWNATYPPRPHSNIFKTRIAPLTSRAEPGLAKFSRFFFVCIFYYLCTFFHYCNLVWIQESALKKKDIESRNLGWRKKAWITISLFRWNL